MPITMRRTRSKNISRDIVFVEMSIVSVPLWYGSNQATRPLVVSRLEEGYLPSGIYVVPGRSFDGSPKKPKNPYRPYSPYKCGSFMSEPKRPRRPNNPRKPRFRIFITHLLVQCEMMSRITNHGITNASGSRRGKQGIWRKHSIDTSLTTLLPAL